ncbi:MAG: isopentenyl transferase family protein, partial [Pseudomonadota bacterium]
MISTDRSGHGLIFLAGSTASGKTDLAIELAARLPVDLISVDSSQVYQGLDIGTAKPNGKILEEVPHGLIDIRSVRQPFSAADFCLEAGKLIENSFEKGRIPLLVGGTMFYFA